MINRALPSMIGALSLSLLALTHGETELRGQADVESIPVESLRMTAAVETAPALALYRPDLFSTLRSSFLVHSLPALTLLDGRRFPISNALSQGGLTPLDFIPTAFLSAVEVERVGASPVSGSDGPGGVVNLRLNRLQTGGEVGFFYGRSDGKYGRDDFGAHIIGTVGNEKFQISAGAAFQESTGRFPRSGR